MSEYKLVRRLGRGGFGEVFEGWRGGVCDGERVAIKRLSKSSNGMSCMDRIRSEVGAQRGLLHENVVKLKSTYEDADYVYLVLEFCEGGTLYNALERRQSPFDERSSTELFLQLLAGLSYLHSKGIVHRDVKLSNLFLTKEGVLKIGDFGLAVRANSLVERAVGTIEYMDSDILSGVQKSYLPDVDLWSAGCVFYSLLTRNSPFKTSDPLETVQRIVSFDYDLPGFLSAPSVEILTHLLCPSRHGRWSVSQCLQSSLLRPIFEAQSRSISSVDSHVPAMDDSLQEIRSSGEDEGADSDLEEILAELPAPCDVDAPEDGAFSSSFSLASVLPRTPPRILDLGSVPDVQRRTAHGSIEVKDHTLVYCETKGHLAIRVQSNGFQCTLCSPTSAFPCTLRSFPSARRALLQRMTRCYQCLLSVVPRVAHHGADGRTGILMSNPFTPDFLYQREGVVLRYHNDQGVVEVESGDVALRYPLPGRDPAADGALCSPDFCFCCGASPAPPATLLRLPEDPQSLELVTEGLREMRHCLRLEKERIRARGPFPWVLDESPAPVRL